MIRSWLLSCSLLAVLLPACADDIGTGWVRGALTIPECADGRTRIYQCADSVPRSECEAFDLKADFFALQSYPDHSAKLRLQLGGADFATTDGMILEIRDTRLLRGKLSERLAVGPDENIRAGLGLFRRCPGSTQNFQLFGSITFSRFGLESEDRVTGVIDGVEVRDGRSGDPGTVLGYLRGRFDFSIQAGPPYQRFQM